MDREDHPGMAPRHEAAPRRARAQVLVAVFLTIAMAVGAVMGIRGLSAATNSSISVDPASTSRLWYKPTPITITINSSNFSGAGQTPISGYQYALTWNPAVVQWVSGPNVGPGTPVPPAILPCSQVMFSASTPTPWPTGFVPTYTPTNTNTPGAGTPTNTRTITPTPSLTPTPAGYIKVACASLSQATPVANGVIGTFTFRPIATGAASTGLGLIEVQTTNFYGATVVPVTTAVSGSVTLSECHDIDGNGIVNILDLSIVAAHYNATSSNPLGPPTYVAAYDINGDGRINIIDLASVAAGYRQTC